MKPIERAARALALSDSGVDCWDALDPAMQAKLIESARAVLGAVREPSEAMKAAAWFDWPSPYEIDVEDDQALGIMLKSVIDAALSE